MISKKVAIYFNRRIKKKQKTTKTGILAIAMRKQGLISSDKSLLASIKKVKHKHRVKT